MAKWIYARTASNDAAVVNTEYIKDIALDGDGSVHIGWTADAGDAGVIQLTTATGDAAEASIVKVLAEAISHSRTEVLVIADDVTSEYINSSILSVDTITPSS